MVSEIEINYDNVWTFLLNNKEVYVLRASNIQPGNIYVNTAKIQ